jgi:hypothetical protein
MLTTTADKVASEGPFSEVGSLKLLLVRPKKESADLPNNSTTSDNALKGSNMGPMFDDYATWWELNSNIDSASKSPPFEIE